MYMSVYFMWVFVPHDTVTLRYCQSWSGSSEPATSHSAVLHTQGQECHYLPLHRARQDGTKQHVQFYSWHYTHSGLAGIKDRRPQTWWLVILRLTVFWYHHSPWAAGASVTTPSASVVIRGELKFLLKAPLWQTGRDKEKRGGEGQTLLEAEIAIKGQI